MTKGYLVRWTSADGHESIGRRDTLDEAAAFRGARISWGAKDARILAVADDGAETPVLGYAEALAEIERLRAERDAERKAWAEFFDDDDGVWCAAIAADGRDVEPFRAQRARSRQALRDLGVPVDALLDAAAKRGAS